MCLLLGPRGVCCRPCPNFCTSLFRGAVRAFVLSCVCPSPLPFHACVGAAPHPTFMIRILLQYFTMPSTGVRVAPSSSDHGVARCFEHGQWRQIDGPPRNLSALASHGSRYRCHDRPELNVQRLMWEPTRGTIGTTRAAAAATIRATHRRCRRLHALVRGLRGEPRDGFCRAERACRGGGCPVTADVSM